MPQIELIAKYLGQSTLIMKVVINEETFNTILEIIRLRGIKA